MTGNFFGSVVNLNFVIKHLQLPVMDLRIVMEIIRHETFSEGMKKSAKVSCNESFMLFSICQIHISCKITHQNSVLYSNSRGALLE